MVAENCQLKNHIFLPYWLIESQAQSFVSTCSMMLVAARGHGEIHFHLYFEFHLKLILYFTLNCASILA